MSSISIKSIAALIFLSFAIFGCSNVLNKALLKSIREAKDGDEYFIITNGGKKITGSQMKVFARRRVRGELTLDGKYYHTSELSALQKKDAYYGRFGYELWPRVHKGSIEAYEDYEESFTSSNERGAVTKYRIVLFKNHGEGKAYTTKNLYDLIKNNPKAIAAFNERYSKLSEKTPVDGQYKNLLYVLNAYE